MTKVRWTSVVAVAIALAAPAVARAVDGEGLRLLLLGMQDMNTPQTLQRADLTIELQDAKGAKRTTSGIMFLVPGKEAKWYFQLREPALEALVLGSERKVMQRSNRTVETVPISTPIDGLGITYEDLSRFIASDFKLWQITDDTAQSILVGGHPTVESGYVYRAYMVEKERTLPTRIQFYADKLNNLVKLRVDDEHVLVGNKWFPGSISIEDYAKATTATLKLKWTQAATLPPELLAPASFAAAPALPWTTPAAAAASPKP